MKKLLEDLRHELTTLHGLRVTDDLADQQARELGEDYWELDEAPLLKRIDEVLAIDGGVSLSERIEEAYDRAIAERGRMLRARDAMVAFEGQAKQNHADEWAGAKNNDVRAVLLYGWLNEEDGYLEALDDYEGSRNEYRLALLEIEKLRLLVEAAKAEGART